MRIICISEYKLRILVRRLNIVAVMNNNTIHSDINRSSTTVSLSTKGPQLWRELHLRSLNWDPKKNDVAFLRRLKYRLSAFGANCECKFFYTKYLEDNPPDYAEYFKWTVDLHNAVNKKLNKPTVTFANAKKIWTNKKDND